MCRISVVLNIVVGNWYHRTGFEGASVEYCESVLGLKSKESDELKNWSKNCVRSEAKDNIEVINQYFQMDKSWIGMPRTTTKP
ncbi:hypothetical protein K7X08_004082 [Anisodus acutangulus]|uniref:Uncharacterized protein n=1 Tax=Anisodus acutangulus TaxID=402998 RepID=A0A9Q1RJS5_9SOLA|nr:hypothetical protein K7X08_004082 [Anisodus acutangulus]